MAGETTVEERTIEVTPTWAVATVCFILISVSILIEHLLHLLAKYFNKKRKSSLIQTLDKIKSDLMMLGFMSLILTVSEKLISNICIPKSMAETFLPCGTMDSDDYSEEEHKCLEQGKVSLLSRKGVNQLQYLIFFLAFIHSLSCVLTFSLGMAKMRSWESWEADTRTLEYQFTNDPRRFQFTHQTSFGKRHLRFWSEHSRLLRWPACFLRQFYASVSRSDFLTLRHGFIMAHFAESSNFNFQRYINRALERDFGAAAGMSWWIWIILLLFIFFNAQAFYNYLWLPFIPLVMLLVVGTKLQGIITQMCLDSHGKSHVVIGPLLVRPSDHYFWFNRPKLLLQVIHLVLFQNSFQVAFFAWTWYKFGLRSCFHKKTEDIIIKIALGVVAQMLCGYVTLPLYALVTQMGASMKNAVFPESVADGLKRWRRRARKNVRTNDYYSARPSLVADASVSLEDTSLSLDATPPFSLRPLDSIDHEPDPPFDLEDTEFVAVEIDDEQASKRHQRMNSFDGFDVSSTILT